ncbi:MAG: hypothetical protein ISQ34_00680 [Rickettsiales bacterium]|nr:hypothetical protein [Rickettsiales bacterium]
MRKTPILPKTALFFFIFHIIISNRSFAIEKEANREEVVTARSKRFYEKSNKSRRYLAIGGSYASKYNSKEIDLTTRYLHQTSKFINELNFINENEYDDRGSGENRKYGVKTSESYDLVLSSKIRFKEHGKYYTALFHRTLYDDLSIYYYDIYNAVGIGKIFFNEKTEIDVSIGQRRTHNAGNSISFIPSIRTNFQLSKNLRLTQRGYLFIDNESLDNGIKTRLVYRLNNKLSVELRHNFEQRKYEDDENRRVVNLLNRSITFGVIFDL